MKLSEYNIFVEKKNAIIGFNTINNTLVGIHPNAYSQIKELEPNNIESLEKSNEKLYHLLVSNGFIIPNEKSELNEIRLRNKEYCFNKHYDLILIPTLDCNLKCWYCWESHIPESQMTKTIQKRIVKHIEMEIAQNNFDSINLEWFGGEPMLYFDKIVYPLCSSIKKLVEASDKQFYSSFITNATFINKENILKLKEINPGFQITIDGERDKHNKVRVSKKNDVGTYDQIINALYLISDNIPNANINLRINFDNSTLYNIENLISDLNNLNKDKLSVHLERVWQTKKDEKFDNKLLQEVMLLFTANNFQVEYGNFVFRDSSCKTDRYKQMCINYDGKVYKCNGRPFVEANCDGEINENGEIITNRDKLTNRLGHSTFEFNMCKECKLLPLCMGPCSQKCIENKWQDMENKCTLKSFEMSVDDYVVFLFNNLYNSRNVHKERV
jgi:uncharacterized protein